MNRLAFAEFHQKHFSPEQKEYWKHRIYQYQQQEQYQSQEQYQPQEQYQQQQQQYQQQDQQQDQHDYNNTHYNSYQDTQQATYEYGLEYEPQAEQEQEQEYEYEYEQELSKEAIEIFKFSEAYRKERELERQQLEKDEQEGMEDWQYDESSVNVSGGVEAPATSLVLLNNKKVVRSERIKIQEDLLNSVYLQSCRNEPESEPVVLWPVLPFKL